MLSRLRADIQLPEWKVKVPVAKHVARRWWRQLEGQGDLLLGLSPLPVSHLYRGRSLCPKGLQRGFYVSKESVALPRWKLLFLTNPQYLWSECPLATVAFPHVLMDEPLGRASPQLSYWVLIKDHKWWHPDTKYFILTSKPLFFSKQLFWVFAINRWIKTTSAES